MGSTLRQVVSVIVTILITVYSTGAEQKRHITLEDCVRTKRVLPGPGQSLPLQISPDGSRVAYIVKCPDGVTNRNNYRLFVRELDGTQRRENGRLLLQADRISEMKWVGRDRLVARSVTKSDKGLESELDIVNATNGQSTKLEFPVPVADFSISSDGKIVAFSSLTKPDTSPPSAHSQQQIRDERGYPIIFGKGSSDGSDWLPRHEIYVGKIIDEKKIEASKVYFTGPGAEPKRSSLSWVRELKLSPNGQYLLLKYSAESLPEEWREHPLIKQLSGLGTRAETHLLGLYEIATGKLRLAFNYPGAFLTATWADDSRAYSVASPSPLGSSEEKRETEGAISFGSLYLYLLRFSHMFSVDVKSGLVAQVIQRDSGEPGINKFQFDEPLIWKNSDEMTVRTGDTSFAKMDMSAGRWKESSRFEIPDDGSFKSLFSSYGNLIVGISQGVSTPPDVFVLNTKTGRSSLLTDLNPEYRGIALGDVEKIEWTNRYGSRCSGKLIKPVGYDPGRRYPLVLMATNTAADNFISDALYTTAFAPQPLADAGFVVLMSSYPLEDKVPRGEFPGEMGQAYNWISMMETAIDLLVEKGIADRENVGIVGFSRTSWLVDFMLTHSGYKFTAASSADSGIYTYDAYYRLNRSPQGLRGDDTQMGGPPYGETRKYWLEYAPPFNAEKVTAPVLMEYPATAEHGFEFFVALSRLGKPAELYRYPKGEHPLDTPFERVASLQRNVDWFRFWMWHIEGKPPAYDPDQYARWRKLRDQQQWNDRMQAEGKDPGAEFLRQTSPGAVTASHDRAPAVLQW